MAVHYTCIPLAPYHSHRSRHSPCNVTWRRKTGRGRGQKFFRWSSKQIASFPLKLKLNGNLEILAKDMPYLMFWFQYPFTSLPQNNLIFSWFLFLWFYKNSEFLYNTYTYIGTWKKWQKHVFHPHRCKDFGVKPLLLYLNLFKRLECRGSPRLLRFPSKSRQ